MMATKTLKDYSNMLKGTRVVVEDENGDLFTGVLRECSDELEIELTYAQKMPTSEESKFVLFRDETTRSMKLKALRLSGDYTQKDCGNVFCTDSEIGVNAISDSDKEFQHWEDDGEEYLDELSGLNSNEAEHKISKQWKKSKKNIGAGWSVDDMYLANKDKCVGQSSYDENLSQYSNVAIGKHTKEELERAAEIAKQIEMNPLSRRNALLENDDEERDLDALTKFEEKMPKQIDEHESNNKTETSVDPKQIAMVENNDHEDKNNNQIQQDEQDDSKRFTFNPHAMPFVPKTKDLNSNNTSSNNFLASSVTTAAVVPAANTFNNLMSSQISTFVNVPSMIPMQSGPITNGISHPNIVYNNPIVYPQHQPQAVVQNALPLYAYTGNGAHQPTIFLQAPNTTFLIQQQNVSQQQYIPVSSNSTHANQNYSHSRTATPTNESTIHHVQQQGPQQLIDAATSNTAIIQQPAHQTNVFHNPQIQAIQTPAGQVISAVHNVLPLMNIPQVPPHSMLQQSNNVNTYPQHIQLLNGNSYIQHQHFTHNAQPQHNPQQSHTLVRNPTMQAQQYFQQATASIHQLNNNQQQQSVHNIYAASTYGHSLLQQPQYQAPCYIAHQNPNVMPPTVSMPPPLSLQLTSAAAHGVPNIVGRQQQQH